MTNLEKFLEVFGYEENADNIDYQCLSPCLVEGGCEECRHFDKEAAGCDIEKFWQSEYKEPNIKFKEKIANAKPSTWLTDGLTKEEVKQIIDDAKEQSNAYLNSINASIGAIRLDIAALHQSLDKAADVESEVEHG